MKKIMSLVLILCFSIVTFGQTTAEATGKAFYSAWKTLNKAKMAELATPKVAKQKNLHSAPDPKYKFEACNLDEDTNSWYCVWRSTEIPEIAVSMQIKKVGGKFKVIWLGEGDFEAM